MYTRYTLSCAGRAFTQAKVTQKSSQHDYAHTAKTVTKGLVFLGYLRCNYEYVLMQLMTIHDFGMYTEGS